MRQTALAVLAAFALLAALPTTATAQVLSLVARAGAYLPIESYTEVKGEAQDFMVERSGTFALGGALDLNFPLAPLDLRVSADYITGSTVTRDGVQNGSADPDKARTLFVAGDVVLRPIPRLFVVQPYGTVGAGYRHVAFETRDADARRITQGDLAGHVGIGLDFALGGVGVVAELSDYITRSDAGLGLGIRHDAFLTTGVRVPLF